MVNQKNLSQQDSPIGIFSFSPERKRKKMLSTAYTTQNLEGLKEQFGISNGLRTPPKSHMTSHKFLSSRHGS